MDYYELHFKTQPTEDYQQDLLIDALGDIGFDTFEELEDGFKAYIPIDAFNEQSFEETVVPFRQMFPFAYERQLVKQKNWNELWESNFEPISIKDKIYVRATFHLPKPEFLFEIVIDPKMAFGTGHHQTTAMMLEWTLETELVGKTVLDMGCGTGILAIMASKLGAHRIVAIDYDPVCYSSTVENASLNGVTNIEAICGSAEAIPAETFDIILANINRNILLEQIPAYNAVLKAGGQLYLSGFYETPDLEIITNEEQKIGLRYLAHKKSAGWVAATFVKESGFN